MSFLYGKTWGMALVTRAGKMPYALCPMLYKTDAAGLDIIPQQLSGEVPRRSLIEDCIVSTTLVKRLINRLNPFRHCTVDR